MNGGFTAIAAGKHHDLAVRGYVGDIKGDGRVDVSDLLILARRWGKLAGQASFDARCDLNNDGAVDVVDLLMLADNWGQ